MLHTPGDPRSAIATRSPHATPSKPTAVAGDPITVSAPPPHPSPLTARPVAFPFPDHRRTPPSPSIPSPSPSPIPANRPPLPSFSASPSALGKPRGGTLHGALGWDAMQCACWAVGVGGRRSGGGSGAGGPGARAIGPGARIAWGRGMATRGGRLVIGGARRGGAVVLRQSTIGSCGRFLACCVLDGCWPRLRLAGVGDSWLSLVAFLSVFLCCNRFVERLPYPQKATRSNRTSCWAAGRGVWLGAVGWSGLRGFATG